MTTAYAAAKDRLRQLCQTTPDLLVSMLRSLQAALSWLEIGEEDLRRQSRRCIDFDRRAARHQALDAAVAAMLQIPESDCWECMTSLESLTLSDISNLSPKSSFLGIARLPALRHVTLRGSMPADTASFKTLMLLSHTLGARGMSVDV